MYATALHDHLAIIKKNLDPDVHIVFEVMPRLKEGAEQGKSKYICNYYLVKHSTMTVFWLDDVDAGDKFPIYFEVMGVESRTHIRKWFVHIVSLSTSRLVSYRPYD